MKINTLKGTGWCCRCGEEGWWSWEANSPSKYNDWRTASSTESSYKSYRDSAAELINTSTNEMKATLTRAAFFVVYRGMGSNFEPEATETTRPRSLCHYEFSNLENQLKLLETSL